MQTSSENVACWDYTYQQTNFLETSEPKKPWVAGEDS